MTYNWNPPRHFDGNYCIAPATMRTWEAAEIDAIANRGRELMAQQLDIYEHSISDQ